MKTSLLAACTAALALCSCTAPPPAPARHLRQERFHVVKKRVYHFADGRVGYPANDDSDAPVWYWLLATDNASTYSAIRDSSTASRSATSPIQSAATNRTASTSYSSPTIAGGWSSGPKPSAKDLEEAEEEEQGVVEDEEGRPATQAEAEEVEAADPAITETDPDAAPAAGVAVGVQTEAETAADEAAAGPAPSESAGTSESSGSSDSGDGGGGGGD